MQRWRVGPCFLCSAADDDCCTVRQSLLDCGSTARGTVGRRDGSAASRASAISPALSTRACGLDRVVARFPQRGSRVVIGGASTTIARLQDNNQGGARATEFQLSKVFRACAETRPMPKHETRVGAHHQSAAPSISYLVDPPHPARTPTRPLFPARALSPLLPPRSFRTSHHSRRSTAKP